ncbi:MAG: hypothetical protein HQM00_02555 [Magnetococcales bacterium]|nr:hypothetical protein [Magnetococcales bacterium]
MGLVKSFNVSGARRILWRRRAEKISRIGIVAVMTTQAADKVKQIAAINRRDDHLLQIEAVGIGLRNGFYHKLYFSHFARR